MMEEIMEDYFDETFIIKRVVSTQGKFSDGEGSHEPIGTLKGHTRKLKQTERTQGRQGFMSTHRLYTTNENISYGDILSNGDLSYRIVDIDHKGNLKSSLSFLQVDLEVVI